MGKKFMSKMVALLVAATMIMTSGVFAFAASSPTVGKVTKVSSDGGTSLTSLKVTWKKDGKADGYIVKVGSITKKITKGTTTSKTITGLTAGKTYKVSVTPVYKDKKGKATKGWTRWMKSTKVKSVKASGKKKLAVKWTKTSGATGYKIMVYKNGKHVKTVTVGNRTSKTISVSSKGKYTIKVRPMKDGAYGVRSKGKAGTAK